MVSTQVRGPWSERTGEQDCDEQPVRLVTLTVPVVDAVRMAAALSFVEEVLGEPRRAVSRYVDAVVAEALDGRCQPFPPVG